MNRSRRHLLLVLATGLAIALTGIVMAAPAATLPVSKGVYRLPYADDTNVVIGNDHTTHSTPNRLDMRGTDGSGDYTIVAAGEGWIRWIEDQNTLNCDCNTGTCNNNFIWMEHPNGEWSKYSHIAFNTAMVAVGQYVSSGTPLGTEGDVGRACGQHLHFEIAKPYVSYDPQGPGAGAPYDQTAPDGMTGTLPFDSAGGYFIDDDDGDDSYNRQNRIPTFCGLDSDGLDPGQGGPVLVGETYTATVCQVSCPAAVVPIDGVLDGEINHFQATDEVFTFFEHVVAAGGGEAFRAGERVILSDGFHAEAGSFFSASIGTCDTPGAQ